ncbi:hypothetical protein SUGI_1089640 [Cryptomeria japonica]|uniref:UPF0481 protein At3g47200-like n=1 Tax=Cryptomeria japonica TaxID=3369 RepID=UPI002414BCC2|nr:UPF0481 protein At3g47200-like [Cryptomeria japonica]XP_057869104.2 UPF0481 protein At3g47200-like [Cryptomeria japonica]GLJ51214.1 hypothetical protein SUGI_1089640 [Cryptomeria japonica]
MSEKGGESATLKETGMRDKGSESAWVEEVKYRYTEGAWSRKKMRESFGTVCIYRTPMFLRDLNTAAYTPRVVSLGLFNHQPTKELSEMDRRKVDALLKMWQRLPPQKQTSLFDVFNKESCISRITSCYEEETDAADDTVVWTCLLDGCFILEILRVLTRPEEKKDKPGFPPPSDAEEDSDPIYNKNRIRSCQFDILGDFFMMENQIPIVVLVKLLQLEMDPPQNAARELYRMLREITLIVHPFLARGFRKETPDWIEEDKDLEKYNHMLGLFHSFVTEEYLARGQKDKPQQEAKKDSSAICISIKNCMGKPQEGDQLQTQGDKKQKETEEKHDDERFLKAFIKSSASELFNSGMKFVPYYGVPSKEKLSFDKNKRALSLPTVFITDSSEMIFRNLMAMEACRPESAKHISYYVLLMNTLIEGEEDVAVLRRAGVIQSSMGTDDEVTDLFNELCKGLNLQDIDEDPFVKVKFDLNGWYNDRHMVKLKKWMKKNPKFVKNVSMFWAILLVLAAGLPTLFPIFQKYIKSQNNS